VLIIALFAAIGPRTCLPLVRRGGAPLLFILGVVTEGASLEKTLGIFPARLWGGFARRGLGRHSAGERSEPETVFGCIRTRALFAN